MNDADPNLVDTALELLQTGIKPNTTKDGTEYLVIPARATVYDLEKFLEAPRRIRQALDFDRLESFCGYVNEFKGAGTKIFMDMKMGKLTAVLDYHQPGKPSWGHHRANFEPLQTEEWTRWRVVNGQWMNQEAFALFLDENAADVTTPPAGEMLDMSRNLTAKISVNFKKGIRLENGTEQIQYEEAMETKAGHKGQLEVPSSFTLSMALWEGCPKRPLEARLRYKIKEGTLSFCSTLVRPHIFQQAEIEALRAEVLKQTKLAPLCGGGLG